MKQTANSAKSGPAALQGLKELYREFGYTLFKMSKFEEYDTYAAD